MTTETFQDDDVLGKAYDSRLMRRLVRYLHRYRAQVVWSVFRPRRVF